MTVQQPYPKRLIEVDLPIKRISAHARREKSIRHGHISTLHIWWARRPLAACRAVICASLWPDPADPHCPQSFRDAALKHMTAFAKATQSSNDVAEICDQGSWRRYMMLAGGGLLDASKAKDLPKLRQYLLDFIADFAAWEASTNHWFLDTARSLTQAAHEALGGEKGTRPLVVDPFAGGGAIPLEALRVGADAFASDLNPVAVLLNKVVLEYIPKYGQKLADGVRKWGQWVKEQAEKELAQFYPKDADGSTPVAYLWARTIKCEGPGCGAEVPLMRSLWLANKGTRSVGLKLVANPKQKRVGFEIIKDVRANEIGDGTVKRGSATCPCCGFTTPVTAVRAQLKTRDGGANDARLFAVVLGGPEQVFRVAKTHDLDAIDRVREQLRKLRESNPDVLPDDSIPLTEIRRINVPLYGMCRWSDLFTPRQLLTLATLGQLVRRLPTQLSGEDANFIAAVQTCVAFVVDKAADYWNTICTWMTRGTVGHGFARQAIPATLDYVEASPFARFHCSWPEIVEWVAAVCEQEAQSHNKARGQIENQSATSHLLPDDAAAAVVTDPPYYDAVPYAHLADFFYVWLRRMLGATHPHLFSSSLTPKADEIVVDRPHELSSSTKTVEVYERQLTKAFAEARRVVQPHGLSTFVFASKTTASWEAFLQAIVDSGWIVKASWPIDTEREARLAAMGQARLASSVHLCAIPRELDSGELVHDHVGDWRDVLAELPVRTREWMTRLSSEGVVGADAIFACLGPALEIFSRYSRVEKASGDQVMLKEYLTYVWGAVAQEALTQIFKDADASGFEEDARLTAMWLWTLNAGSPELVQASKADGAAEDANGDDAAAEDDEEEGTANSKAKATGYVLEFDAARKIAQGLGAHLEQLSGVIEVKGDKARLLGVAERTKRLFGKDEADAPTPKRRKKDKQMKLFSLEEVESEEGGWGDKSVPKLGDTTLDRVHQSMILFAAGRGEALRRFLVEDGGGRDQRFWKLANALSALYPQGTDEKRWVDGVLARKKGLGL